MLQDNLQASPDFLTSRGSILKGQYRSPHPVHKDTAFSASDSVLAAENIGAGIRGRLMGACSLLVTMSFPSAFRDTNTMDRRLLVFFLILCGIMEI